MSADLPPDAQIIERAKAMLLQLKGFGMENDTPQTISMSPARAERLVALAMLGLDIRDVWADDAAPKEVRDWLEHFMAKWTEKTNLLAGTIVKDNQQ